MTSALNKKPHYDTAICFALGGLIGVLFFCLVYGISTLNVTYDSWIYAGYVEGDIIQRYAGWLYFREAPWSMPPTVATNISQPQGMAITYADSVPLMAMLCKLFEPILPQTFQYIGWYNLLNCVLQSAFAFLIFRHFSLNRAYCAVAAALFVSYPIFVERVFRHDGLASQWIILAAFLCYFKAQRGRLPFIAFVLLCTFSASIHMYFLPMVYALFLAAILAYVKTKAQLLRASLCFAASGVGTIIMMYILGIITRGGDGASGQFSEHSMNLNALFNPSSLDFYAAEQHMSWSNILPVLPQNYRQYEGFNYLGFGIILTALCAITWVIYRGIKCTKIKSTRYLSPVLTRIKRHTALLVVCLIMAVFSISNIVVFGTTTLLTIPLPSFIHYLGSVFRACGRFFWPMSYLILISLVLFIANIVKTKYRILLISLVLITQLFDLSGVLYKKHEYFAAAPIVADTVYETEHWKYFAENYDKALFVDYVFDYSLVSGLIRYNPKMQTNALLANRGDFSVVAITRAAALLQVQAREPLPEDTIFISEFSISGDIIYSLHESVKAYKFGKYIIVATAKNDCPVPEYLP